jgi:hypothetical protein
MALMRADTEQEVVSLLSAAGYWEDFGAWRPINDEENNFSTIGNQQSEAVAAFVEKIVNGVDSRLLDGCLRAGEDPQGVSAPKSMREAVARYFERRANPSRSDGRISDWSDSEVTAQGRLLTVAATGNMPADGQPSLTVADQGEGQTPDAVPTTFMSLQKSNKLRIPFVQGKFNMGGTGALQFCAGPNKLQLIVTRRDPELLPAGATARDRQWSFTIVRREKPRDGARSSMYTYLAPVTVPGQEKGGVLSFDADTWPIFPEANDSERDAYAREAEYGSLVKLYEYEWQGTKTHIVFAGDGLLRRIDVALPELALPVRLYECRPGYKGGPASFATNAMGLVARLERDRGGNMEEQSPIGAGITLDGKQIPLRIYIFLPDKAKQYRTARQGVVFGVNGQTHGTYPIDFFRRTAVGMAYLARDLLVFADCSAIEGQMREDLFMNSRDRLRDTPLARELESKLEAVLRTEPTLRELGNRRRQALLQDRLQDDKPLADVLQNLVKTNPMLSKLLLSGMKLSSPFPPWSGTDGARRGASERFVGKRYPTFFRFKDRKDGEQLIRAAAIGSRARITMETDAEDSYFVREDDRGTWTVKLRGLEDYADTVDWTWTGPKSGIAQLWIDLPSKADVGEKYEYLIEVTDPSRIDAFSCKLTLNIVSQGTASPPGKPNKRQVFNEGKGNGGGVGSTLSLPEVILVREADWALNGFDEESALKVVNVGSAENAGRTIYDFYVNVDNKYLKIIQKESRTDADLLEKQFTYGFVLVGLALLQDRRKKDDTGNAGMDAETFVAHTSRALAPMLIPMIQTIGGLSVDDI